MPYTDVWDSALPTGAEAANTIATIFRGVKVDIQERFIDIFGMPNFTADPLRPYAFKYTDAADGKILLGDNAGTPRSILLKNKADSVTYATWAYTGLTLSPPALTGGSTPFLSISQTWNNGATTFVGILVNITNTASAAASLFFDYQVGGVSQWKVSRAGVGTLTGVLTAGGFVGPLTGNVTGNVTGSAGSVAAANITGTALPAAIVSSSLTSVGTIATGVWNGTVITGAYGGTGFSTFTAGDLLVGSGGSNLTKLAVGSNGEVLTVVAGNVDWAPPSFDNTRGTAGPLNNSDVADITPPAGTSIWMFQAATGGNRIYFILATVVSSAAGVGVVNVEDQSSGVFALSVVGGNVRLTNVSAGAAQNFNYGYYQISDSPG